MPYKTEWIDPEIFLEHGGIIILHTYKDDDFDRRLTYWYAIDDEPEQVFDVRAIPGLINGPYEPQGDFAAYLKAYHITTLDNIRDHIRRAIDHGLIAGAIA